MELFFVKVLILICQNVCLSSCACMSMCAKLTHSHRVIQFEAAEDLADVSCVEKPVASNDHLETL